MVCELQVSESIWAVAQAIKEIKVFDERLEPTHSIVSVKIEHIS